MIDSAGKLIDSLGFPTVVCLWFMFRLEWRIDRIVEAVRDIHGSITRMEERGSND